MVIEFHMRKKRTILIAIVPAMLLAGLAWIIFHPKSEPPEPMYQGKPLSQWLAAYDPANTNRQPALMKETQNAIRQMGTNSIPIMLRMLERHDSPIKARFMELMRRQSLFKTEFIPELNRYERAAMGLEVLGQRASNAVPELIRIYDMNHSQNSQVIIARVLGLMGPTAQAAVPSLLRDAASTNNYLYASAVFALSRICSDAHTAVPVLVDALQSSNRSVRITAASRLGAFGPEAKAAVPALLQLLEQSRRLPADLSTLGINEVEIVAQALQHIDPATAATVVSNSPPSGR
jgi:hypothetical protein